MNIQSAALGDISTIVMGISPNGMSYNNDGIGLPLLNGPAEFGPTYPHSTLYTTDSERECQRGDLIFCVRGNTTGRMNWADQTYSLGRGVCSVRGKTPTDTRYIRYCLEAKLTDLLQMAGGSTMPNLTQTAIKSFTIPYGENRGKIAAILSAYDDMIENNLRRIKILEEMTQNLYREWFTCPFRGTGMPSPKPSPSRRGASGEGSPRRLVDSALGPIPEGWEVKEMREVAEVIDCLHSKKPEARADGKGLLLQLFNVAEGGRLDLSKKKYLISEPDYELWTKRIEVSGGDCIVTNVGRIAAVAQIPHRVKAALGRNMTAIRVKAGVITSSFLIEYLLSPHMEVEVRKKKDTGTVMDSLNVKGIVRLSVPVPPFEVMTAYERIARPLRQRVELLMTQNAILRQTRSLLVPKLISGEVDVEPLDINTGGKER